MSTPPAKKIGTLFAAKAPAKSATKTRPAAKARKKTKVAAKALAAKKAPATIRAKPVREASPVPDSPGIVATLAGISTAAVSKATGHGSGTIGCARWTSPDGPLCGPSLAN